MPDIESRRLSLRSFVKALATITVIPERVFNGHSAPRAPGESSWFRALNARAFAAWWWTVDRFMLTALLTLMLAGIVLSLAASPPVAAGIGLEPFYFVNRHVMFSDPGPRLDDRDVVPARRDRSGASHWSFSSSASRWWSPR